MGNLLMLNTNKNGVNQTVANNKWADQTVISPVVVNSLENITAKLASRL